MLFHDVTITVSAISDFQKRDQFDVIKGMVGEVKMNWDGFIQSPLKPLVWWRYIDDVFMIWLHGEEKLNEFVSLLNSSHETIKFTHEVSPSKINFLDVTVLLHYNSIATDLHLKSTDAH